MRPCITARESPFSAVFGAAGRRPSPHRSKVDGGNLLEALRVIIDILERVLLKQVSENIHEILLGQRAGALA
jgi:hypothetical protein